MTFPPKSLRSLTIASMVMSYGIFPTVRAQQPPPPQEQPQPPKMIRKSGGVFQTSATKRVEPTYPPLAKAARVSGSVVVEVTADEEGNVISARALSGHPLLKDAAVAAAKGWKFSPTMLSGVLVKVIGTITFNFYLDYSKDIEALQQKLDADPNSARLHYELGQLFSADRQHEKAIEELTRALSLGGDSAQVLLALGEAYQATARFGEASEAYKRGLGVNPLPGLAETMNLRLGEVYLKQEHIEDALEAFKQAVVAKPDSVMAHYQLGLTYLKIGDRQSALNEYTILKDLSEQMAETLHRSIEKNN